MGKMTLLLLLLAACGEKRSAPADRAADAALADRWVVLYGEYAAAMEAAGADCARVAAAVREVSARNRDLIATGKPQMAKLRRDPDAARWLDDTYKKSLGAALDRMAPTLDRCRGDAGVSAALSDGAFERKADQPR